MISMKNIKLKSKILYYLGGILVISNVSYKILFSMNSVECIYRISSRIVHYSTHRVFERVRCPELQRSLREVRILKVFDWDRFPKGIWLKSELQKSLIEVKTPESLSEIPTSEFFEWGHDSRSIWGKQGLQRSLKEVSLIITIYYPMSGRIFNKSYWQ